VLRKHRKIKEIHEEDKMTKYAPYKIPDYLKPLLEEQARIGRYELEWEGIDSNYLDRGFGCSPFHGIPRDYDTPNEYMERKKRYEEIEEEIDRLQEEHGEVVQGPVQGQLERPV
jgi:hypothetical protein